MPLPIHWRGGIFEKKKHLEQLKKIALRYTKYISRKRISFSILGSTFCLGFLIAACGQVYVVVKSSPVHLSLLRKRSVGSLGNFFEELQKHTSERGGASSKSELAKYLDEEIEVGKSDFDVLIWWKVNSPRFPHLSEMARDVLAIPVSSVASECAFSTGGRILDSFRSSLTPKLVQALVCLQDWLRSESQPISIEEDLDFLEQLEEDLAKLGKELCIDDM